MLYNGLAELGVPVVCIESRQAYLALKTLATHKADRNDARGLSQLADGIPQGRACEVAAGPCHPCAHRRPQEARRPTRHAESEGLAVVFGIRLPRGLSPAFVDAPCG